ncbi:MAG: DUF5916 domain-containing protein [Rhodothermales bacterium]|nr:DUF5916 domain-containing protein [Rhodothermales bacterium]
MLVLPAQAQPQSSAPTTSDDPLTADTFVPNEFPRLTIGRMQGDIAVDGELNDTGWRSAAIAQNFSEFFPVEKGRPSIAVRSYLTYDEQHLYVAFVIEDDPTQIRANLSDRDNIWQDDYVGFLLDTRGDGREVYFIASNPLGIQGDTRITTNNEDLGFDLIYKSEGRITDEGYQVEMAIPFRSLRFQAGEEQAWRATFWITHPRSSRSQYTWAAVDRDDPCWTCQYGYIEGIQGVKSGGNLEIMPGLTGSQAGALAVPGDPDAGFNNDKVTAEPSLDLKYGFTSALTADLSVNPDFSQIEADVAQIDVNSTFALFFPERRPFFQEGSDLFDTPIQTVYTRSINDPIVASKLTGQFGSTNVAYIGARDNTSPLLLPSEESSELLQGGKSWSNIVRAMRTFPNNSNVGALVTDRRLDNGGAGSTVALDASLRFLKYYRVQSQFVVSQTVEANAPEVSEGLNDVLFAGGRHTLGLDGESYGGSAVSTTLSRESRNAFTYVEYEQFSPTFRADNGFVNQNDARGLFLMQGFNFFPKKIALIDRIGPRVQAMRQWNYGGLQKEEFVRASVFTQMKRQTFLFAGYTHSWERFRGVAFDGLRSLNLELESNFSEPVSLGVNYEGGRDIARNVASPEIGKSLNLGAYATIRPTARLRLSPQISYSRLTDLDSGEAFFDGYIARLLTTYQFTRQLSLRAVAQYNDFSNRLDIDPLLTFRINPFSAFYIGSTHGLDSFNGRNPGDARYYVQTERQIFFKFQYLFRS